VAVITPPGQVAVIDWKSIPKSSLPRPPPLREVATGGAMTSTPVERSVVS